MIPPLTAMCGCNWTELFSQCLLFRWRSSRQTPIKLPLFTGLGLLSPPSTSLTPCYSALIALYTPTPRPSSDGIATVDDNRSQRARVVMQQISEKISSNLVVKQCFSGRNHEDMSPWGLYMAYRVCAFHMGSGREDPTSLEVVKGLNEGFHIIDYRWNAAGTFPYA